ncbi:MAG: uracil-DNA glycosylase [Minisyncoccia bacterium]
MILEDLNNQIIKCEKCPLSKTRTNVVPGEGDPKAEIMFIGEGPGKKEDELGRPFVGAAGKLLDKLIGSIGLKREDVFIANVVKCRPPENRDPLPEEVDACRGWLDKQVEMINPKLIVLLGRHSMDRFLPNQRISINHGKPKRHKGRVYFPVYHPAAALYRNSLLDDLKKDFRKIPSVLGMIKEGEMESDKDSENKVEQTGLGI